jgi:hypothetical protein
MGKDVSAAIGGTSVTGCTGGEVAAVPISGAGFGAGAMACFGAASVALASMALASGAGKASEGKAVMLAGGSVLGEFEACCGLNIGLGLGLDLV